MVPDSHILLTILCEDNGHSNVSNIVQTIITDISMFSKIISRLLQS